MTTPGTQAAGTLIGNSCSRIAEIQPVEKAGKPVGIYEQVTADEALSKWRHHSEENESTGGAIPVLAQPRGDQAAGAKGQTATGGDRSPDFAIQKEGRVKPFEFIDISYCVAAEPAARKNRSVSRATPPDFPDVITSSDRVITTYDNKVKQPTGDALAKYARYMSDVSSMLIRVNSRLGTEGGKTTIDIPAALGDMYKLIDKWSGKGGILASFSTEEEARNFLKNFPAGTLTITAEKDKSYVVRFDLKAAIKPLLEVMVKDSSPGKPNAELLAETLANKFYWSNPLPDKDDYSLWLIRNEDGVFKDIKITLYGKNLSAQWDQQLNLGIDEVKRTHAMESQAVTERFSRVNRMLDEIYKMFASMTTLFWDLAKSCLGR